MVLMTGRERARGPFARSVKHRLPLPAPRRHEQEIAMTHEWPDWPLSSFFELGPFPELVRSARLHARKSLADWGLADLADRVELVASEIVTNAIRAASGLGSAMPVRLWLLSDKENLAVLVWDADISSPVLASDEDSEDRENGRGLKLVDAMSDQWSWYPAQGGGKVVWALFMAAPPAGVEQHTDE